MFQRILSFFGLPRPRSSLVIILEKYGGGVHKRVDENRELLELLQQRAPSLLQECFWIETWLQGNDEFLSALESLAERLGANNPVYPRGPRFPRPWPGRAPRR